MRPILNFRQLESQTSCQSSHLISIVLIDKATRYQGQENRDLLSRLRLITLISRARHYSLIASLHLREYKRSAYHRQVSQQATGAIMKRLTDLRSPWMVEMCASSAQFDQYPSGKHQDLHSEELSAWEGHQALAIYFPPNLGLSHTLGFTQILLRSHLVPHFDHHSLLISSSPPSPSAVSRKDVVGAGCEPGPSVPAHTSHPSYHSTHTPPGAPTIFPTHYTSPTTLPITFLPC